MSKSEVDIRGVQSTSFIDYPDTIATMVFTGGCNFRCGYCHNAGLVDKKYGRVTLEEVQRVIDSKRRYIKGVVISGGEPTIQRGLVEYIRGFKEQGLKVKLDTNGTDPEKLRELLDGGLVDYIAMDIKTGEKRYTEVVQTGVDMGKIKESIRHIINSGIDYEFRTTVCKELVGYEDIRDIVEEMLKGAKRYYLQNYRMAGDKQLGSNRYTSYSREEIEEILGGVKRGGMEIGLKGW